MRRIAVPVTPPKITILHVLQRALNEAQRRRPETEPPKCIVLGSEEWLAERREESND